MSNSPFTPLRNLAPPASFKKGDVFVLFGELFARGYANGLVEQAKAAGMTILGITVGRRDDQGQLRPLNPEELAQAEANLGGKIINVPLWAGFDMESVEGAPAPVDLISEFKQDTWETQKLDWNLIKKAQAQGDKRFAVAVAASMAQIKPLIPQGAKVIFAHTMAGGIPRAKILLFLTNRAVKGKGSKFLSSARFWGSDIGKLVQENFYAVSANTFRDLIQGSQEIREMVQGWGGEVVYSAYGYHGTEILVGGKLQWQTYNPYLQGLAKIRLEEYAQEAFKKGIKATVFNCPEIRTNSSDLFSGVELSLYPLLTMIQQVGPAAWAAEQEKICQSKLKDGAMDQLLQVVDQYHQSPVLQAFYQDFPAWPRHNEPDQAEIMLDCSDQVMAMNLDRKDTVSDFLSGLVLDATGLIMFRELAQAKEPVLWLGHDIIAKALAAMHS